MEFCALAAAGQISDEEIAELQTHLQECASAKSCTAPIQINDCIGVSTGYSYSSLLPIRQETFLALLCWLAGDRGDDQNKNQRAYEKNSEDK
jgi:hypothetical protein